MTRTTTAAASTPPAPSLISTAAARSPRLCTQSAPISNSSFANNSADWRLSHFIGQTQLTGYRDLNTFKFRGLRFAEKAPRFTYSKLNSFDEPGEVDATNAGADCSQRIGEVKNGSSGGLLIRQRLDTLSPPP